MTVQVRCFTYEDLPYVVRLLNEERKNSYEYSPYTEDSFRAWMQEGRLRILIAEDKKRQVGSAAYYDSHWGEEIEWLIVSSSRRIFVESLLLAQTEKYVRKDTVFTAVSEKSPKIKDWVKRGYRLEGGLYHMIASVKAIQPLPKTLPESIILRNLRKKEESEFVNAVNAGFGNERVKMGDIKKWKVENPTFNERWIHVAEANGEIVSLVVSKPDVFYNKSFGGNRGYLGPASTLPEYRCKGLVSALTVKAMNFLLKKGMSQVALYTSDQNTASCNLLQKIGFRVSHHWQFMRKNLRQLTEKV